MEVNLTNIRLKHETHTFYRAQNDHLIPNDFECLNIIIKIYVLPIFRELCFLVSKSYWKKWTHVVLLVFNINSTDVTFEQNYIENLFTHKAPVWFDLEFLGAVCRVVPFQIK